VVHKRRTYNTLNFEIFKLIERTAPPWGVFLLGWFPNDEPGGRGPVLYLSALDLETTQEGKSHQQLCVLLCLIDPRVRKIIHCLGSF